jgi:biopolymer transport protein TolR
MPATLSRGRGRRTINEINMVPFIDVMLVLLIIFMVTAPLIQPSVVDLPSIGKANKQADHVVRVVVLKDESLEVSELDAQGAPASSKKSTNLRDLIQTVRQAQKGQVDAPVVISADRSVKYEHVVKVMDALQKGGVSRVGLSVILSNS